MRLKDINTPDDLKRVPVGELQAIADELRDFIIDTLSTHPGHLASSLGTVELTVALHYVFNTPDDKLVWDVGHQAYAHKILTGRREAFNTIRTYGGLSGFPKMAESPYDAFGTGHSSTSISAALGMATASKLQGNTQMPLLAVPVRVPKLTRNASCSNPLKQCLQISLTYMNVTIAPAAHRAMMTQAYFATTQCGR